MPHCRFCDKYCKSLGIARHETACFEKMQREREAKAVELGNKAQWLMPNKTSKVYMRGD